MKRRWFIRVCFVLAILLCVGGWVRSAMYDDFIDCSWREHGYWVGCESETGFFSVQWGAGAPFGGLLVRSIPEWRTKMWRPPHQDFHFLGVGFTHLHFDSSFGGLGVPPDYSKLQVDAPYWFLLAFFSVLSFFIWRKTRPKPNPKTAFPVEVKSQST